LRGRIGRIVLFIAPALLRGPQELMAKCMSNKDAPRGKPVTPAPKA